MPWQTIFIVAALLCALGAAFLWPYPEAATPSRYRPHLGWLAFAFYVAAQIAPK